MIYISPSPTAGGVPKSPEGRRLLQASSAMHIGDVAKSMALFGELVNRAASMHDDDKIQGGQRFFEYMTHQATNDRVNWWQHHQAITRHHLASPDGVRDDVNLVDVLEYIADCVVAGTARNTNTTGAAVSIYPVTIDPEVLQKAFDNTVRLLVEEVRLVFEDGRVMRVKQGPAEEAPEA